MADVFLSYAREDRERAADIAQALEANGWSVWWDRRLPYGRSFSRLIEQELDLSKCVLVLWSHASVKSDWVTGEAAEGLRRQILIPAMIDREVRVPLEFRRLHTADLTPHLSQSAEFDDCLAAVATLVSSVQSEAVQLADGLPGDAIASTSPPHVKGSKSPAPRLVRSLIPRALRILTRGGRKAKASAAGSTDDAGQTSHTPNSRNQVKDTVAIVSGETPNIEAYISTKHRSPSHSGFDLARKRASIADPNAAKGGILSAGAFNETYWEIHCRRSWPSRKYVYLRTDGAVGLMYEYTRRYEFDGTDTWRVEGDKLIISFSLGFSVETYSFVEPPYITAPGIKRNVNGRSRITRLV